MNESKINHQMKKGKNAIFTTPCLKEETFLQKKKTKIAKKY